MDMTRSQVRNVLNISDDELSNLINDQNLPLYHFSGEERFNLLEIESWLITHQFWNHALSKLPFNLYRALSRGQFLFEDQVLSKDEVLRLGSYHLSQKVFCDPEALYEHLKQREQLASTGFGKGFAVPHPRERLSGLDKDTLLIMHFKNPIEFDALDGQKVHTCFFLLSGSDKGHLNLLSKIAHIIHDDECNNLINPHQSFESILSGLLEWEKRLQERSV